MSNTSSESTIHFGYHPVWRVVVTVSSLLALGSVLYIFVLMLTGRIEPDLYEILFLIAWLALAAYNFQVRISSAVINQDGLEVKFLLFRTIFIPWDSLHELRIGYFGRHGSPMWSIMYGQNPTKNLVMAIGFRFQDGQNKYKMLFNGVIDRAELTPVRRNLLWARIYKRD